MLFLYACGYTLSLDLSGGTSRSVPSEEKVAFARLTHIHIRNFLAMFYRIITLPGLCAFLSGQLNMFLCQTLPLLLGSSLITRGPRNIINYNVLLSMNGFHTQDSRDLMKPITMACCLVRVFSCFLKFTIRS